MKDKFIFEIGEALQNLFAMSVHVVPWFVARSDNNHMVRLGWGGGFF